MTVNTSNITSGPYTGNGASDQYSYTFRVEDKTQLKVFETTDAGVETELTVDTDYTVAGIGDDAGGIITRVAGNLPTDYVWYIRSDYESTQLTALASQGGFFPDVHEAAMDKLTFLIQQLYDLNGRAFRLSESDPDVAAVLAFPSVAERADKLISFDGNGVLQTLTELGTWRGDWVTTTDYAYRDIFRDPADGSVYFVIVAHTSTSIAADLAASKIVVLLDVSDLTPIAVNVEFTPAGGLVAVDVQNALEELDSDKQADLAVPPDAEAAAGTATTERVWTAAKVKHAIDNLGKALGTKVSKSENTVYQAAEDGFFFGVVEDTTSGETGLQRVEAYSDSSATPTTLVGGGYLYGHSAAQYAIGETTGFCVPVKSGDYYKAVKVDQLGTLTSTRTYYWVPLS